MSGATPYGFIKPIGGLDVCERQSGVLCGQHSINNLLQETKIVSLPGNDNLFVSGTGPDGRCFTNIDALRNRNVKINMKAVCKLDNTPNGNGYCNKLGDNDYGFYADSALEYVLHNILLYDINIVGDETGIPLPFDIWTADVIQRFRNDDNLIGILLNFNMNHWTCITKGLASCPSDRPNAFLDSMNSTTALCLSNDELGQFFSDKRANIRGYLLVGYRSKGVLAYNSVAKQAIETKRLAAVGRNEANRMTQYNNFFNYIFEITGRRFNYANTTNPGSRISDILKLLKLNPAGPQTIGELQNIARIRDFSIVIDTYLPDYDGYTGIAAAPAPVPVPAPAVAAASTLASKTSKVTSTAPKSSKTTPSAPKSSKTTPSAPIVPDKSLYERLTTTNTYKKLYERVRNTVKKEYNKRVYMPQLLKDIGALPGDFKKDWSQLPEDEKDRYKYILYASGLLGAATIGYTMRKGGSKTYRKQKGTKALKRKTRNRRRN